MHTCKTCGAPLHGDDIPIYRKLCDLDAKEYLCRPCLAAHFGCDVSVIDEKIRTFRAAGCALFPSEP